MIYEIICSNTAEGLYAIITERLAQGWKLQGGLAISIPGAFTGGLIKDNSSGILVTMADVENRLIFCQAMVKGI